MPDTVSRLRPAVMPISSRLSSILLALLEVRARSLAVELGGDADFVAGGDEGQIVLGDLLAAFRGLDQRGAADVGVVGARDQALHVVLRELELMRSRPSPECRACPTRW